MQLRIPDQLKGDFEVYATAMNRSGSSLILEFVQNYISAIQEAGYDQIGRMEISWNVLKEDERLERD
ncbi:MAG: hypothetical protein LC541_18770 [Candidatus Thiodiazotropha sp.]|nr:hypothetical protein [Candidatus Thiodiazotropha sp.]MCM8885312.1 hypothetical protein [Candidatus Thiodiazotropha sp.]MCM8921575.1 hypothetical protein [Candidatus Thiodiazotropha sp.]